MFSVYSKNKGIGLAVPIVFEATYNSTPISHNIMTTCLILSRSPFCCKTALTCRGMDSTRPLKVCCGIWHQAVSSTSFKSCRLRGGFSMDSDLFVQPIPQMLNWIEIWRILRQSHTSKSLPSTWCKRKHNGHNVYGWSVYAYLWYFYCSTQVISVYTFKLWQ